MPIYFLQVEAGGQLKLSLVPELLLAVTFTYAYMVTDGSLYA